MTTQPSTMLLELQAADVELLRARKRLEDLPEKQAILEVRSKMKEIAALQEKASTLLHKLEAELKKRQDEIASLGEKVNAEQAKIMETRDHRQITALTREMDGLRRRTDKLEMESLQYMERIEKASEQLKTIQGHATKIQEKDDSLVARYRQAGSVIQKEIVELETKRAKLAGALPNQLLSRYESVRDSRGGVAVGRLDGAACSACRITLPAQRVQQLMESGEDIGVCPECRRLIVIHPEQGE